MSRIPLPNMARWLVQLSSERFYLKEFPFWFPDGDVFSIEEDGAFFLVGPALEALSSPEAVLGKANHVLDHFSAIIFLLWPSFKKPTITYVIRETDEGARNAYAFSAGTITAGAKVHGISEGPPQPTEAQNLLGAPIGNPHLEVVSELWADPIRSWSRLYRILEELEEHFEGNPINKMGLCSRSQRERFTRTANAAEVSRADARHATGKFEAPENPMSLVEATDFIGRMIVGVLRLMR
jgi:hypothetical protein